MNNIICICYYNVYVIISLFLFLREFTRVKWSENKNEYGERRIFIFGELKEEESVFIFFLWEDIRELTRLVKER